MRTLTYGLPASTMSLAERSNSVVLVTGHNPPFVERTVDSDSLAELHAKIEEFLPVPITVEDLLESQQALYRKQQIDSMGKLVGLALANTASVMLAEGCELLKLTEALGQQAAEWAKSNVYSGGISYSAVTQEGVNVLCSAHTASAIIVERDDLSVEVLHSKAWEAIESGRRDFAEELLKATGSKSIWPEYTPYLNLFQLRQTAGATFVVSPQFMLRAGEDYKLSEIKSIYLVSENSFPRDFRMWQKFAEELCRSCGAADIETFEELVASVLRGEDRVKSFAGSHLNNPAGVVVKIIF